MPEPLVDIRGASRMFGTGPNAIQALASATCRVVSGDRIAVVGSSGCGKSTLLHLMADLDEPTSGTVTWPLLGLRGALRPEHIAVVFQAPSLLPALTVSENVTLPLLMQGKPEAAEAEARRALGLFGLEALSDKLPEALSGGQAQRVGLARALCGSLGFSSPTSQLASSIAQPPLMLSGRCWRLSTTPRRWSSPPTIPKWPG